jgi:hypothetical protein
MDTTAKPTDGVGMGSFTPNEEWIDAFDQQNTDALRKAAKRFARSRARWVARAGGRGDDAYAEELVQDALTDTLFGSLSWDPAAKSLMQHVRDVVRFRTKDARLRAARFRHQSMDALDPRKDASAAMTEIESSLSLDHHVASPESIAFSTQVLGHIRDAASKDDAIARIMDAIEAGASEPADIMSVAGMSEKTYRKARLRLARLAKQLPNELLLAARCPS